MSGESVLDFRDLTPKQARRLEILVEEIRPEFHDLVARIREKTDHSVFWQVNSLLSRNNHICSVFYHLCCLALVLDLEKEGRCPNRIMVPNACLKKTLDAYFKTRCRVVPVVCTDSWTNRVKQALRPAYDMLRNLHWSMVYLWARDDKRNRRIPRNVPLTLVDTFFSAYIFKSGAFKERYYTGLGQWLSPGERRRLFFVPNVISWRNLKHLLSLAEKADENFLYPFDFLKVKDYLFAISAPILIRRIDLGQFRFRGVPIAPLLKWDFRTRIALRSSFRGILFYRFFRRLKREKIALSRVVDWFENQVVDRGFNLGKNAFYPETPSIGYQGWITTYQWNFHVQPTREESLDRILPQTVGVIGAGLTGIARQFCPDLDVMVSPGLRFSDIHSIGVRDPESFHPNAPVILAALPIWVPDSLDILKLLVQVLPFVMARKARVWVKPHPSLDFDQVRNRLHPWPAAFEVIERGFPDLIRQADLLISTGSTVCMEAIAYGVPVVVIGSTKQMTKNIIPSTVPRAIWDLCFDAPELTAAIDRLCFALGSEDRRRLAQLAGQVRSDFFAPVDRKNIEQLLGLGY